MRFTHEGQQYELEFRRSFRQYSKYVEDINAETGEVLGTTEAVFDTTYPYTTANILKVTGTGPKDREIYRTFTVGCCATKAAADRYSPECGRKIALTLAMRPTPNERKNGFGGPSRAFRTAVWACYFNRVAEALEAEAKAKARKEALALAEPALPLA